MINKYVEYYKKGFFLVSGNLIIYFTSLLFSVGPQIDKITKSVGISQNPFISFISLIIGLLSLGSTFIAIKTLYDASEKKKITWALIGQNYQSTFFKSVKIVLLIIFFAAIWFGIINIPQHPLLPSNLLFLFGLISPLFIPLLTYFGIYYSIKNVSFFDSFLGSALFYRKNVPFISFSIVYGLVNWVILNVRPMNVVGKPPFYYIYEIATIYVSLVISAASLLYFKENDKEKK
ncbi:MAG: hypothetical protein V1922_04110 [bacterium]